MAGNGPAPRPTSRDACALLPSAGALASAAQPRGRGPLRPLPGRGSAPVRDPGGGLRGSGAADRGAPARGLRPRVLVRPELRGGALAGACGGVGSRRRSRNRSGEIGAGAERRHWGAPWQQGSSKLVVGALTTRGAWLKGDWTGAEGLSLLTFLRCCVVELLVHVVRLRRLGAAGVGPSWPPGGYPLLAARLDRRRKVMAPTGRLVLASDAARELGRRAGLEPSIRSQSVDTQSDASIHLNSCPVNE